VRLSIHPIGQAIYTSCSTHKTTKSSHGVGDFITFGFYSWPDLLGTLVELLGHFPSSSQNVFTDGSWTFSAELAIRRLNNGITVYIWDVREFETVQKGSISQ
jgi:hypothetical protein